MDNKIVIVNENGEEVLAEVLLYFSLDKTERDYIIYTFGDVDDNLMETVHASVVDKFDDGYRLLNVPGEDWEMVKEVMRDIIRGEQ